MSRLLFIGLVATTMAAANASASLTVAGTAGAGWQPFPASLNSYGATPRPFWDQDTLDGSGQNRNVGNYLNGSWTGALPGGSAPFPLISPNWWGNSTAGGFAGSMDNAVSFNTTNDVATTLRMELSAYSNGNIIGWYNTADAPGVETLNQLYPGSAGPGSSVTFTPSANFGLYVITGAGHIFFSESSRNRQGTGSALGAGDTSTQHFAIFQTSALLGFESYIIGMEDLPLSGANREIVGDYNDMIFTLTAVPTPASGALLGLGLLASARRRR